MRPITTFVVAAVLSAAITMTVRSNTSLLAIMFHDGPSPHTSVGRNITTINRNSTIPANVNDAKKVGSSGGNAPPPRTLPRTRVVFVCMTSASTYKERGLRAYNTWGRLVEHYTRLNSTFVFFSDVPMPDAGVMVLHRKDGGTYLDAQSRIMTALLVVPHVFDGAWMMMCDDDAFVQFLEVERLVAALDPSTPALYGDVACGGKGNGNATFDLCGGGGALLSPAILRRIRENARLFQKPVNDYYDVVLSSIIRQNRLGELVATPGFHSQPPNWYRFRKIRNITKPVLTFHYLDSFHQHLNRKVYGCEETTGCAAIYDAVYDEFLAHEAPRLPTQGSAQGGARVRKGNIFQ